MHVVDGLEVIDVEQQQCHIFVGLTGFQQVLQRTVEQGAIGQPGEIVAHRVVQQVDGQRTWRAAGQRVGDLAWAAADQRAGFLSDAFMAAA